jgi:exonuclease VII large subunit
MASRIGGNIGDIHATAGLIANTGSQATAASAKASQFSEQMHSHVDEVTTTLDKHFNAMADQLRQTIRQAKDRLQSTDWEGASKAQADAAEAALKQQCDHVLTNALRSTQDFKSFMLGRAQEFVSMVSTDFKAIMADVERAYHDLATASKAFAENLAKVDETIKFNG